ncbi:MAG: transposon-encoded TnpW family protein [Oscillospiraceae bacterium]|nr:transposon-encoded TnpW family protein [Oscillospiraceae bacterium]
MENKPIRSQTSEMKIGTTTYIVHTHFDENARENAVDKLVRLATNRIADELNGSKNAIN